MIEIITTPQEHTRSPDRSCYYLATCMVDGTSYEARSRLNACTDLARVLVTAGVPDQSVEIRQPGIAGSLTWKSLHWLATRMYAESVTVPLHMRAWKAPPDLRAVFAARTDGEGVPLGQNQG